MLKKCFCEVETISIELFCVWLVLRFELPTLYTPACWPSCPHSANNAFLAQTKVLVFLYFAIFTCQKGRNAVYVCRMLVEYFHDIFR